MKAYKEQTPTSVLAEQVSFNEEDKARVLGKQLVLTNGAQLHVQRSDEDRFFVNMILNSEQVQVFEGDWLVYSENGKVRVFSDAAFKDTFAEDSEDESAEDAQSENAEGVPSDSPTKGKKK